jgi:hypothetical protein
MPTAVGVTVLTACPACTCVHFGPGEYCSACCARLSPAERKRNCTVFFLLAATRAQLDAARAILKAKDPEHMLDSALRFFEHLPPDVRTAFFDHERIHGDDDVTPGKGCE